MSSCSATPTSFQRTGWLAALLSGFRDFRKTVIAGSTHLDTGTRYERAVALFWIFQPREPTSELRQTRTFWANNVAFRRPLFARMPFPRLATYRVQCRVLAEDLARRGIPLWSTPAHEAGIRRREVRRGFWNARGRRVATGRRGDGSEHSTGVRRGLRRWSVDVRSIRKRVRSGEPQSGPRFDRGPGVAARSQLLRRGGYRVSRVVCHARTGAAPRPHVRLTRSATDRTEVGTANSSNGVRARTPR